ncbi:MAG TPA: YceI family protein [Luteimonas sp.]|nr:YceI family protein [Luteimonas sp.]
MSHPAVLVWLLTAALAAAAATAAKVDTVASQIGFTLTTRWGQSLEGRFPQYQGEVTSADDGRHQVRLRLSARDVEIVGHTTYTRLTRGDGFFDAAHYPQVEFVSDAYPPTLLHSGGPLPGTLSIRGIRRHEVFVVSPATCAEPARDCDVVATGSIDRGDYGMDRWSFALSDQVRFTLRVRVRAEGGA